MIDWVTVGVSALWISGLALLLATLAFAHGLSLPAGESIRRILSAPPFRLAMTGGVILFALGMALATQALWERIGWAVVVALTVWDAVAGWRETRAARLKD